MGGDPPQDLRPEARMRRHSDQRTQMLQPRSTVAFIAEHSPREVRRCSVEAGEDGGGRYNRSVRIQYCKDRSTQPVQAGEPTSDLECAHGEAVFAIEPFQHVLKEL